METNQDSQEVENQATTDDAVAVSNFLELSDDEIANLSEADFVKLMENQPKPEDLAEQVEQVVETETTEPPLEDNEEEEHEEEEVETTNTAVEGEQTTEATVETTPEKPNEVPEVATDAMYKEVYDRLFNQPIRANNKDLKLNNVDDVIKLVQMGANYNLKMAGIKEQIPYIKILEKNNLLDERELSYLIDLKLGKPEAIARLLKENEVDLYDFDLAQSDTYIPESRGVSHQEIELEEVIKEISTLPKFLDTMDVIQRAWDEGSRDMIRQDPSRLRIISEHVESGMYQKVWEEVERNQLLGNIPEGTTAIQAYDHYGTEMDKLGLLNEFSAEAPATSQPVSTSTESQEAIKQAKAKALKDKKRAATATTTTVTSNPGSTKVISPLSLSDEDFAKMVDPRLM